MKLDKQKVVLRRIRLMEEFNSNYELMGQMRIRMAQALKKFK